jgi:uncharacterized protein YndB with AHSA1/START domain
LGQPEESAVNDPPIARSPIAVTGMLVRKPVEQVFEAIVNPDITTKFWFSKGSGRLETGKAVTWEWGATMSPSR